jgi:hypothetical protein
MGRTACTEPQCLYNGALYLTVELYFYSPYGLYGLYKASVPVQGCTLLFRLTTTKVDSSFERTLSRYPESGWSKGTTMPPVLWNKVIKFPAIRGHIDITVKQILSSKSFQDVPFSFRRRAAKLEQKLTWYRSHYIRVAQFDYSEPSVQWV